MIGQPAEEIGAGAAMMLNAGCMRNILYQIMVLHYTPHQQFHLEK